MRDPVFEPRRFELYISYGEYEDKVCKFGWFDTMEEAVLYLHNNLVWWDDDKYDNDEQDLYYDERDTVIKVFDHDTEWPWRCVYVAAANKHGGADPNPEYVGVYNRVMMTEPSGSMSV